MAITFVPEREARAASIPEAVQTLEEQFTVQRDFRELRTLSVDDNYHLHINGTTLRPTQWAFQHFLGHLGIPYRFGMKIPNDLLDHIVMRLRSNVGEQTVQLLIRDETLVNVCRASYSAPILTQLLNTFGEQQTHFIKMSDRGVQLATESSELIAEPKQGDFVRVGILLRASETGGPYPYARLLTYQMICSNGAVVGHDYGTAKWDARIRNDGFDAFANSLRALQTRSEELIPALNALPERTLETSEFAHLWRQSSRILGSTAADALFEVTEVERKQFNNAARAHLGVETEKNAFTVFEALTRCARDLGYNAGEQMMQIAGQMLGPRAN